MRLEIKINPSPPSQPNRVQVSNLYLDVRKRSKNSEFLGHHTYDLIHGVHYNSVDAINQNPVPRSTAYNNIISYSNPVVYIYMYMQQRACTAVYINDLTWSYQTLNCPPPTTYSCSMRGRHLAFGIRRAHESPTLLFVHCYHSRHVPGRAARPLFLLTTKAARKLWILSASLALLQAIAAIAVVSTEKIVPDKRAFHLI